MPQFNEVLKLKKEFEKLEQEYLDAKKIFKNRTAELYSEYIDEPDRKSKKETDLFTKLRDQIQLL